MDSDTRPLMASAPPLPTAPSAQEQKSPPAYTQQAPPQYTAPQSQHYQVWVLKKSKRKELTYAYTLLKRPASGVMHAAVCTMLLSIDAQLWSAMYLLVSPFDIYYFLFPPLFLIFLGNLNMHNNSNHMHQAQCSSTGRLNIPIHTAPDTRTGRMAQ